MPAVLKIFPSQENSTLRVYCPSDNFVLTSFENYLPESSTVGKISDPQPPLPAQLRWHKENCDYFAYLPKERYFDGHLLAPLNHHQPQHIQKEGRWFVDDKTRELWRSLDNNITTSINVVGSNMLVDLDNFEPRQAIKFGFCHGHRTEKHLELSLKLSKEALVYRLAYLTYLVSRQYQWDKELVDQWWWRILRDRCGPTWVDSVWDAIYRQWRSRNFVGLVVRPVKASVRWLAPALRFGIPIWVYFPGPKCYDALDGGFEMKRWEPTLDQVRLATRAQLVVGSTTAPPPLNSTAAPPPLNSIADPLPPNVPLRPASLPVGTQWYESWQEFFRKREESDREHLQTASNAEKQVWESRAKVGRSFSLPGKKGAKLFIWESCDSGGFLRILQTRHDVERMWDTCHQEGLVFHPRHNVWDYCEFMVEPTVGIAHAQGDDLDEEYQELMAFWYAEPESLVNLPEDNPEPLDFLYRRYGFLSSEPTAPPDLILSFNKESAYRTVGLEVPSSGKPPEFLNSFITSILHGRIPAGHSDLCPSSPPEEILSYAHKALVYDTVFCSDFPELSGDTVFTFINADTTNDSRLLVVHGCLSVLEMMRAGTQMGLRAQLEYLVHSGSRFTLLYPTTRPLVNPNFNILTFPVREEPWTPTAEDFRDYLSRLKTFFLERPYMVAAAFSRGGIAWRIAQEVLGLEGSVDTLLVTFPDLCSPVRTSRGKYWAHKPDEGEWYYLVGGYEVLTGM